MCRRNQLLGCGMSAFGLGLVIGIWLEGGFLPCCLGLGLMLFGFSQWCRRS